MIVGAAAESSASMETASTQPAEAGSRVVDIGSGSLQVRLAETAAELDAAQALRYRIFYEIMGARPLPGMAQQRRDLDRYDQICDHLLVLDHSRGSGAESVVGTYRLIRRARGGAARRASIPPPNTTSRR